MSSSQAVAPRVSVTEYALVGLALALVIGLLVSVTGRAAIAPAPNALLGPIFALVGLTVVVGIAMALVRNLAVFFGKASVRYYHAYVSETPDERIERPARTFNNLLEVPMLFYVVCGFLIATAHVDSVQVALAWIFVASRIVHALIYIAFNRVPFRFAAFIAGCITLTVMWARFAGQIYS